MHALLVNLDFPPSCGSGSKMRSLAGQLRAILRI